MQKKYIRFQEVIKDEKDLDLVITVATIKNQSSSGLSIQSGPSYSLETYDLSAYNGERVEYVLTPQEFDELNTLYENNKKAFLLYKRGETDETTKY